MINLEVKFPEPDAEESRDWEPARHYDQYISPKAREARKPFKSGILVCPSPFRDGRTKTLNSIQLNQVHLRWGRLISLSLFSTLRRAFRFYHLRADRRSFSNE